MLPQLKLKRFSGICFCCYIPLNVKTDLCHIVCEGEVKMSLVKNIILIIIIILLLAFGIKQQLDINTLDEQIESLENQLESVKYENEKKQNELDMSFEERAEKYAKEDGYKDPDARYFYNDFAG